VQKNNIFTHFSSCDTDWHSEVEFQGSEKPGFLKKPSPLFLGFGLFYSNEQLGSMLVDLAHRLNFYLDSPVLYNI